MNTPQKKILFADDDQDFLFAVKEFYEKSNWQFDFAENGVVALDLAMKESYDLISLDINMPFMKGNEAIQNIRQIYPDQKIIAFTAITDHQKKIELLQAGFDEIISKPVSFQQMHTMFKRILNESSDLEDQTDEKPTTENIDEKPAAVINEIKTPESPVSSKPAAEVNTIKSDIVSPLSNDKKMEFMKKYSFSLLQNESKETLIMMIQGLAREVFDLKNKE